MSTRRFGWVLAAAATTTVALSAAGGTAQAAPATGSVQIVQAVPKSVVGVQVDGRDVDSKVSEGQVLGPLRLSAGRHAVRFVDRSGSKVMRTTVSVKAGSSTDVVLHNPAAAAGEPVVNVYQSPRGAIGPGKARILIAHTATAPAADVRLDGKTVFRNIANGEFAQADVPSGRHVAALLPAGETTDPLLGPLDLNLKPRTVTMVYAVGQPSDRSMKVISHTASLGSDGSVEPGTIKTGSAGLVADRSVQPFGPTARTDSSRSLVGPLGVLATLGVAVAGAGLLRVRGSGRRGAGPA